jgi:hypothetical protein
MPTSSAGRLSTAGEHEISNGDIPPETESPGHGERCVDPRAAVRFTCILDAVDRLHLVRGREDRLPAEHLANQLAVDVRALYEVRLDDGTNATEVRWDELADAIAASAADPLGDKLGEVVDQLTQEISELLGMAPDEPRTDEPRPDRPHTAVSHTDQVRA